MAQEATTSPTPNEKPVRVLNDLLERIRSYYPSADLEIIKKAYEMSEKAHKGQIRRSGEAYIFHPLSVAGILTELKLDLASIATGILHDTVEDTTLTLKDIETHFGKNVAYLVDGVTKISQMEFKNTHAKQAENIRKMIVAMGKDIRVILVKLADRLHNMRTLNHMPYHKQARIAEETLDIYAPLAHRLGISQWKIELEDLALKYLKPDIYYDLSQKVARKKKEREKYIEEVKSTLFTEMKNHGIDCEVQGRPKHLYSIYKKMLDRNIEFEQVHDVLAFRIMVNTVPQCYEALGLVHNLFRPVPGRFKDYIAMAKTNNYQSLHTTVIGPEAERIEIQIRTQSMHEIAERGIAAHWNYKIGGADLEKETLNKFNWLKDILSLHQTSTDSGEFFENVKTDLFDQEIYVFTPKGDVFELPEGATALDIAYAIHTELGHKTTGAKVDGKMVPLKHQLKNGDTVELLTSPHQKPSKDWLKMCITSRAQSKIRSHIRIEERKRAIELGSQMVEKEFRSRGLSSDKTFENSTNLEKVKVKFKVQEIDELYMQVGYGKTLPNEIADLFALAKPQEETKESFIQKVFKSAAATRKKSDSIVIVDGMPDLLVRFGKCCQPIPGDSIIGFISRGRGVTIHRSNCPKIFAHDMDRRVDVEWNSSSEGTGTMTKIQIISQDAPGLLQKLSEPFANNGVNIYNARIRTNKDQKAICIFDCKVKNTQQLSLLIQGLQKVKGVIKVERITS